MGVTFAQQTGISYHPKEKAWLSLIHPKVLTVKEVWSGDRGWEGTLDLDLYQNQQGSI